MEYNVEVKVFPKGGVIDPISMAMNKTMSNLGYGNGIKIARAGKLFSYTTTQGSEKKAREEAENICRELLTNSVVEQYEIVSIDELVDEKAENKKI